MKRLLEIHLPAVSLSILLSYPFLELASRWARLDQRGISPPHASVLPDLAIAVVCLSLVLLSYALFSLPSLSRNTAAFRIRSALILLGLWGLFQNNAGPLVLWLAGIHPFLAPALAVGLVAVSVYVHTRLERSGTIETAQTALLLVMLGIAATQLYPLLTMRFGAPRAVAAVRDDPPASLPGSTRACERLVVLIFDEFDAEIAFQRRPASLSLPAFDRLARRAVVFEAAYPVSDWTVLSIPAMIAGKAFDRAFIPDRSTYLVRDAQQQQWHRLQDVDGVFRLARATFDRIEIYGWYLPYCGLFGHLADICKEAPSAGFQFEVSLRNLIEDRPFPVMLRAVGDYYAFTLFGWTVSRYRVPWEWDRRIWRRVRELHSRWMADITSALSKSLASDSRSLVWIHMPVPHPPAVTGRHDYFAALSHADLLLADVMNALQASPQRDSTALIVTSDHALRQFWFGNSLRDELGLEPSMTRSGSVPLFVHFPGQANSVRIRASISNAYVNEIVRGLITGQLQLAGLAESVRKFRETQLPALHHYPFD